MSQRQISQWRSVGFAFLVLLVLAIVLMVVAVLAFVKVAGAQPQVAAAIPALMPSFVAMFGSLCTFAGVAVVAAFGKSLGEKAADGPGFKGMARALMTEAKPGETGPAQSGPPATPPVQS